MITHLGDKKGLGDVEARHGVAAALGGEPMLLALKSGNFGAPDFFSKAFEVLA